jgi:two-component system, NtrC family, nitrogen regulation sensor histidine kinase NtrY
MLKKSDFLLLIFAVVSLSISSYLSIHKENEYDINELAKKVQTTFNERSDESNSLLLFNKGLYKKAGNSLYEDGAWVRNVNYLFEDSGKILMFGRNDSILFLSHNSLPVRHEMISDLNYGVYNLENGWYQISTDTIEDVKIWLFALIKNEYKYRNKFLRNSFYHDYNAPDHLNIIADKDQGLPIKDASGNILFSLEFSYLNTEKENEIFHMLSILFGILGLSMLLTILVKVFGRVYNRGYDWISISGLFVFLLLIRFLMLFFELPIALYSLELFSASHFASSYWLPSLGDFFTNILFGILFSFFLFIKKGFITRGIASRYLYPISFTVLLISAIGAVIVVKSISALVINSNLHFNVKFIFSPDIYHIIGFLALTGIFLFYYFLSYTLATFIRNHLLVSNISRLVFISLWLLITFTFLFIIQQYKFFFFLIYASSLILVYKQTESNSRVFSLARILFVFFIYSIIATYGLYLMNHKKELATRQTVSLRIASEQDPVAEFLFNEIEPELIHDKEILNLIVRGVNDAELLNYLKQEYFRDFWTRYDIQVTICSPDEVLLLNPFEDEMLCHDLFAFYAMNFGKPTLSNKFLYLDNNSGRSSYLAIVPFDSDTTTLHHIYIEFESRFIPKELGFPELLVDEQIDITRNLGEYSYAIYKKGILTNKFGSFFYNINIGNFVKEDDKPFHIDANDGYSHLIYFRDEETSIVVSKPEDSYLEMIAPFSYLFIFFLIYAVLFWIITHLLFIGWKFSFNFRKRLQFTVIGLVLISVVAIGSASAWFIFNIYKNKNEAFINEKAHSVLIEMENNLAHVVHLDVSFSDFLNQLLLNLSQVFFTDINIYDIQGNLLSSSRSKVFDEGLLSPLINPVAYNNLKISGKSLFIHNERIGKLEYISAYVPLRNMSGDLIAFINLPYFAQQSELRNEISFFLVAFINIYLLLLLLSVVIAYFISNYVTRPLQTIRNSISGISIGKTNEKILWNRDDEIGQLVAEYNRMIDELEHSAGLLAQSERESAWREMAKQVAHEIKNPLTPMRLNVQYLQRAWNDKVDDWDERLEKFTKTMVEQIDTLSIIAGEFSDFAKMPSANNGIINLREFIPEIPDLYKGFENVDISIHFTDHLKPMIIFADRKQLLRVFNNLIKNSIQSYTKNERARIRIVCVDVDNTAKIDIIDFGGGIADDLKKNIFQPYFTTKTAGMGLGLAMVKSIIQSFNGQISFESQKGVGTTFIIQIPLWGVKK